MPSPSAFLPGKPAVAEAKAPPTKRDSSTIKKDIKVGARILLGSACRMMVNGGSDNFLERLEMGYLEIPNKYSQMNGEPVGAT